jgi:hypothetical protein
MDEITLNGINYTPKRLLLRKWLEFEKSQKNIIQAVEDKNVEEYARNLYVLISTALNIPIEELLDTPWYEIAQAYSVITNLNRVKEIPLLKSDPSTTKDAPWEYDERPWFWWVNVFAKNYSWTISVIGELDINDAMSLLQEVLVDEQLQKEWEWGMSEIAYPYNESTKKSEFHKLDRPVWMTGKEINLLATKVRFRKSMLPVGMIVGESGDERIVD